MTSWTARTQQRALCERRASRALSDCDGKHARLQALLSGNLLLRWSKEVKQFEEREQSRVIEEWNFVNRIVNSIPYDVTHFSASPIAETLRVLAQVPDLAPNSLCVSRP